MNTAFSPRQGNSYLPRELGEGMCWILVYRYGDNMGEESERSPTQRGLMTLIRKKAQVMET